MNVQMQRTNEQNTRTIQEQNARILRLENNNHNFIENRQLIDQRQLANNNATSPIKLDLPTFKGISCDKPMKFIKQFSDYITGSRIDNRDLVCVISQALRGPASEWWEFQSLNRITLDQFIEIFKERFWNANVQSKIRRDLEFGTYKAENNYSRSTYVMNLYNNVKHLRSAPEEAEIIEKLSRHFDEQTQVAILMRDTNTIKKLIQLLDTMDLAGTLNSEIKIQTPIYVNPTKIMTRPQNNYNYNRRQDSPLVKTPTYETKHPNHQNTPIQKNNSWRSSSTTDTIEIEDTEN